VFASELGGQVRNGRIYHKLFPVRPIRELRGRFKNIALVPDREDDAHFKGLRGVRYFSK
jgi:hypothetical protein